MVDDVPRPEIDILFVHVPKTGGTSVKAALIEAYGQGDVYHDYEDEPGNPTKPISFDPDGYLKRRQAMLDAELGGRKVVTGHLWAKKYEHARVRVAATVLRSPIERALSHYFFWLSGRWPHHAIQTYVVDEQLSFEDFVRLPMIRYLYTGLFFRDVDMASFDVIVPHQDLRRRWLELSAMFGTDVPLRDLNATGDVMPAYAQRAGDILNDARQLAVLRDILSADQRFYERHCA